MGNPKFFQKTYYVKSSDITSVKTSRAGVIPYVAVNGNLHFLLGRDVQSGDLTDFGGGVKKGETAMRGAIREFKEETHWIFDEQVYAEKNFEKSVAVTDYNYMTIFFVRIEDKWLTEANKRFYGNMRKAFEVDRIVWLHENRFRKMIYYGEEQIWSKVRNFLCNVTGNLYYMLKAECNLNKYVPLYTGEFVSGVWGEKETPTF